MHPDDITRRRLLSSYLVLHGAAILSAQQHAHHVVQSGQAKLTFLDPETAAEIEAIAAQIVPKTDTPGAREAGVIYFIDRALATFESDKQPLYKSGLAAAQAKRRELFPGSKSIAALETAQQIALLQAIDKTEFFEIVRTHTLMGLFANPSYGGNREEAGWKLIGFEDAFQFQPPFGYYDAHQQ